MLDNVTHEYSVDGNAIVLVVQRVTP